MSERKQTNLNYIRELSTRKLNKTIKTNRKQKIFSSAYYRLFYSI